jgi:hypothetical protein
VCKGHDFLVRDSYELALSEKPIDKSTFNALFVDCPECSKGLFTIGGNDMYAHIDETHTLDGFVHVNSGLAAGGDDLVVEDLEEGAHGVPTLNIPGGGGAPVLVFSNRSGGGG